MRVPELGPVVTLGDFVGCFPYDDSVTRFTVTGEMLMRMFGHWMRNANRDGEGECYQVNGTVRAVHDDAGDALVSLDISGVPVDPAATYTVGLQGYHAANVESYLALTPAELEKAGEAKVVTTSAQEVLQEWLRDHQNERRAVGGRLVYR